VLVLVNVFVEVLDCSTVVEPDFVTLRDCENEALCVTVGVNVWRVGVTLGVGVKVHVSDPDQDLDADIVSSRETDAD
jgi:hypothetical protein